MKTHVTSSGSSNNVVRKRRRKGEGALHTSSAPSNTPLLGFVFVVSSLCCWYVGDSLSLGCCSTFPHRQRRRRLQSVQSSLGISTSQDYDESIVEEAYWYLKRNSKNAHAVRTRTRDHIWNERYDDLVDFYKKHGHTNVPLTYQDSNLSLWVRNQRAQYRHLINGRYSSLTKERINKLAAIKFNFGVSTHTAWIRRYNQLVAYKDRFGHCNVPQLWAENPSLGRWVAHQRIRYRNSQLNRQPRLSSDRIKMLNGIGFVWRLHEFKWLEMLERTLDVLAAIEAADKELSKSSDTLEHDDDADDNEIQSLPLIQTPNLGQPSNRDVRVWIDIQRYHYAQKERGEYSSLTDDRIEKMEKLPGFKWVGSRGPGSGDKSSAEDWSKLFEEAKEIDVEAAFQGERDVDDASDFDAGDLADLWAMED